MVAEVRQRLLVGLRPDAFNIGVNDGIAAGQTVDHAHVHVIPRRKGDVADRAVESVGFWMIKPIPGASDCRRPRLPSRWTSLTSCSGCCPRGCLRPRRSTPCCRRWLTLRSNRGTILVKHWSCRSSLSLRSSSNTTGAKHSRMPRPIYRGRTRAPGRSFQQLAV